MTELIERRDTTEEETVRIERETLERRRRDARRRSGRLSRMLGRRPRLKAALIGLLVAALVAGGVYVVGFSSLLAAKDVEVTGTTDLAPVVVESTARVPLGRPLARVDLDPISARVASMPEVARVEVSRSWPNGVRIQVTERVAVAVVDRGQGFRALDADGVLFKQYPARPEGLPLIQDEVDAGQDALREAALVAGSLPAGVLERVEHLSVKSVDDITLTMRSGRLVLWGNAANADQKAEVLGVLMKRDSKVIDVRVPGRPTTR